MKKNPLKEMQEIARSRDGKCLSIEYKNSKTHLEWECANGHRWSAVPDSIKHGNSWCPKCAHNTKLTLDIFKEIAERRGGKCLSKTYVNNSTLMKWECSEGHIWNATGQHIRRGVWCSKCN